MSTAAEEIVDLMEACAWLRTAQPTDIVNPPVGLGRELRFWPLAERVAQMDEPTLQAAAEYVEALVRAYGKTEAPVVPLSNVVPLGTRSPLDPVLPSPPEVFVLKPRPPKPPRKPKPAKRQKPKN